MRHIFFAAFCTLCVISALLSLPPIGEPHATLVAQTPGDRLSTATATSSTEGARMLMSPAASPIDLIDEPAVQVLGAVELALPDFLSEDTSLRSDVLSSRAAAETTTTATDTTTTAPTTTTTSTTSAPTTTVAPETSSTSTPDVSTVSDIETDDAGGSANGSSGGVLVSDRGVVLPIIGPAANGGWRATTPCGNEVTMTTGERVLSVDFVLDPGHGGDEQGASGPNGAIEKTLNLRIAEIVQWYLEEAGFSVLLTRQSDIRLPLRSRADIATALSPDAFVSIHHNGGATRKQSKPGTELFVDGGNPESRRLGGIMFEELTDRLSAYEADWVGSWRNGVSARLNSDGADLYGIHRYTPGIVSVITEAGYLSNSSEADLFVDNDFQWSHGRAIAEGLMRWQRTSDPGSGYLSDFVDDSSSGTGGFAGCTDPKL